MAWAARSQRLRGCGGNARYEKGEVYVFIWNPEKHDAAVIRANLQDGAKAMGNVSGWLSFIESVRHRHMVLHHHHHIHTRSHAHARPPPRLPPPPHMHRDTETQTYTHAHTHTHTHTHTRTHTTRTRTRTRTRMRMHTQQKHTAN